MFKSCDKLSNSHLQKNNMLFCKDICLKFKNSNSSNRGLDAFIKLNQNTESKQKSTVNYYLKKKIVCITNVLLSLFYSSLSMQMSSMDRPYSVNKSIKLIYTEQRQNATIRQPSLIF